MHRLIIVGRMMKRTGVQELSVEKRLKHVKSVRDALERGRKLSVVEVYEEFFVAHVEREAQKSGARTRAGSAARAHRARRARRR